MPPTTSEVTDYLRGLHAEDPIALKSRERVLRAQAEGIKHNQALPGGQCGFCSRNTDKLIPVPMRCCQNCVRQTMERGNGVRVMERPQPGNAYCDKCLGRTFTTVLINPFACQFCVSKIGTLHKYNLREIQRATEQRMRQRREATT